MLLVDHIKEIVNKTLKETRNNQSKAAKILGISRTTLRKYMTKPEPVVIPESLL